MPRRWSAGVGSRSSRDVSTGTSVTATNSDIPSEIITTMANWPKMMLAIPVRNNSGRKTAICVRVDATIAPPTSSAPSTLAVMRSLPPSMWRKVFSSTTIEASTIIPTPSASPPNVSVLRVKPAK